jgi:hypothetical protein
LVISGYPDVDHVVEHPLERGPTRESYDGQQENAGLMFPLPITQGAEEELTSLDPDCRLTSSHRSSD